MWFRKKANQVSIIILVVLFGGCELFNFDGSIKEKLFPNLKIKNPVQLIEKEIGLNGGEIIVANSGEMDGLKISIPLNSYQETKVFTIASSEIKNHKLGDYFNPISPLIQVGNGGGYADSIMEISIPIVLPEGHIPLGFFYNNETGELESIPIKSYTKDDITLLTRHFMSISDLSNGNLKGGFIDHTTNIVVGSISEQLLKDVSTITSGFEIGIDNWEFSNHGSYIAPGGHCAGQNIAAMWYYYEKKKKGEADLNGRFSTLPNKWFDNGIGYRFCSMIHKDLDWNGKVASLFGKYIDLNKTLDLSKFYTIAASMLITGEPQGIGIFRIKGYDIQNKPLYNGHDLICYKIDVNTGKLFIADPNWPKDPQEIQLKNNQFQAYKASSKTASSSYLYNYITYYAKTAFIEWDQIGKRYNELVDSTIGNIQPNAFPAYKIWALEKMVDTDIYNADKIPFLINNDTLRCIVECPQAERGFRVDNKNRINYYVYNENGKQVNVYEQLGQSYVLLNSGWNKLGFYLNAWRTGYKDNSGKLEEQFIDFRWLNIYRSGLSIEPNPLEGEPGEELTIRVISENTLPSNIRYEWNLGDGNKLSLVDNNEVKYTYNDEGVFIVSVQLFDNTNNELIGDTEVQATIASPAMTVVGVGFDMYLSGVYFLRTDSRYYSGEPYEVSDWGIVSFEVGAGKYSGETSYSNNEFFGTYTNIQPSTTTVNNVHAIFYGNHDSLDIFVDQTIEGNGTCPEKPWLDIGGRNPNKNTVWTEKLSMEFIGVAFYRKDISEFYDSSKVIEYEIRLDAFDRLKLSFETQGTRSDGVTWSAKYLRNNSIEDNRGDGSVKVVYE